MHARRAARRLRRLEPVHEGAVESELPRDRLVQQLLLPLLLLLLLLLLRWLWFLWLLLLLLLQAPLRSHHVAPHAAHPGLLNGRGPVRARAQHRRCGGRDLLSHRHAQLQQALQRRGAAVVVVAVVVVVVVKPVAVIATVVGVVSAAGPIAAAAAAATAAGAGAAMVLSARRRSGRLPDRAPAAAAAAISGTGTRWRHRVEQRTHAGGVGSDEGGRQNNHNAVDDAAPP